jgi:hypothetical protein
MAEQSGPFFRVYAKDGAEKRVMWDSVTYTLPEGGEKIFPESVARHFQAYHPETVEVEEVEGEVELRETAAPAAIVDPDTGEEFGSVAELVAAVKARAHAPKGK